MKKANKNLVKTSEVRVEIKSQKGSVCQVIKGLYSYKGTETPKLNKILPSNAKELCAISARICKEMNVGEVKKDKAGNVKLNKAGEEMRVKFTQSLLISWLLKNQKTLKTILKEQKAERGEKAHEVSSETIEAACAEIQSETEAKKEDKKNAKKNGKKAA